jgi:hypothetical protein
MVNRPLFEKRGITFGFYENIRPDICECDVIFLNSKFFRSWQAARQQELYDTLSGFKAKTQKIIWFDTTDSTGTTQFNVMPFVDGYYKSQVLKDRSLYQTSFYGNRIFTDYYRKLFGRDDATKVFEESGNDNVLSVPLKEEYLHKLGISWNSAMNDWGIHIYNYTYTGLVAKLKGRLPFGVNYSSKFIAAATKRDIDICGRIGLSHARDTVKLQREKIVEALKDKFRADTSIIPRHRYIRELRNAKIAVSPFGLGEISCRDFEIIINGALLYKQDMSHLETWPPLYKKGETYVAFSWDLSDFEDKLKALLEDEERIKRINEKAQQTYEYYLYGDGRAEFCNKVMGILG